LADGPIGSKMLGRYTPHAGFTGPARATPELPRLLVGVLLIETLYAAGMSLTDATLALFPPDWSNGYYDGTTRLGLIVQLFSFVLLAGAVILTAQLMNKRGALSLWGSGPESLRQMRRVTLAVLALFLATELLPPYWSTEGMEVAGLGSWLALLPVSIAALTMQIGAEELFYRGYVQQQIAARFESPWIWLTVPNLLFAYAHWDVDAPLVESTQYVVWAFLFGLAASDLTARTGSLGAACGFHLANNIYAFMFFGDAGANDRGLALFLFRSDSVMDHSEAADFTPDVWLSPAFVYELSLVLLMWLAARLVLRR